MNCIVNYIVADLLSLNNRLNANGLKLKLTKTVQMNIKSSAFRSTFFPNFLPLELKPVCKYVAVFVDNKRSFVSHVDNVKMGILSKLRHFVPRSQPIRFYSSIGQPIIQYGLLVSGCTSYNELEPILKLQKKFLKFIYFRNRCEL